MAKQPFYHRMVVLWTATADTSDKANTEEFQLKLEGFLNRNLGSVVKDTVNLDVPVDAEPGNQDELE